MRFLSIALLALSLSGAFAPVLRAVEPNEMLKDPALEARARKISAELRCLVCQNQSIDDSNAPLAHDLRVLVRERLKAGDTDQQVISFLVQRYGEFVLLRPRFIPHNYLLWLAPALLLAGGGWLAFRTLRRTRKGGSGAQIAAPAPLSEEEKRRLARLLDETP